MSGLSLGKVLPCPHGPHKQDPAKGTLKSSTQLSQSSLARTMTLPCLHFSSLLEAWLAAASSWLHLGPHCTLPALHCKFLACLTKQVLVPALRATGPQLLRRTCPALLLLQPAYLSSCALVKESRRALAFCILLSNLPCVFPCVLRDQKCLVSRNVHSKNERLKGHLLSVLVRGEIQTTAPKRL